MNPYCRPLCQRQAEAQRKREKVAKVKIQKEKKRDKKNGSVSKLTKDADKLWSEAVKINYNYSCQYCWKVENLNSHHLFTRSRRATRWDIDNWMCLCAWCHTLSSNFSAHQTPLEFFEWLEWIRGRDWIDELSRRSRVIESVSPDLLRDKIGILKEFIEKNKLHNM